MTQSEPRDNEQKHSVLGESPAEDAPERAETGPGSQRIQCWKGHTNGYPTLYLTH
jgi:hypothetical protein